MAKTAFFFGAGVSVPFGYPTSAQLMRNIFSSKSGKPIEAGWEFEALFQKIVKGFKLSTSPLGIVDVLSLLDYSIDQQFRLVKTHKKGLEIDLRRLIERRIIAKWREISFSSYGQQEYRLFQKWVELVLADKRSEVAFISTNYDYELEHSIFNAPGVDFTQIDHGFSWRDPSNSSKSVVHHRPVDAKISLFKLHGSVNWLQCPSCKYVYINSGQIAGLKNQECHCGFKRIFPLLVTPSLIRSSHDPNLSALWQAALETLRVADHWVIAGCFLPTEDIHIRSMLIRAHNNRNTGKPPKVTVVQIDTKAQSFYEELFPGCEYQVLQQGFTSYCQSQLQRSPKISSPNSKHQTSKTYAMKPVHSNSTL